MQALTGLGHTSQGGRIRSRIIFQQDQLWTAVIGMIGGWGRGRLGGSGNRTV